MTDRFPGLHKFLDEGDREAPLRLDNIFESMRIHIRMYDTDTSESSYLSSEICGALPWYLLTCRLSKCSFRDVGVFVLIGGAGDRRTGGTSRTALPAGGGGIEG